jgi:hypothetical protein
VTRACPMNTVRVPIYSPLSHLPDLVSNFSTMSVLEMESNTKCVVLSVPRSELRLAVLTRNRPTHIAIHLSVTWIRRLKQRSEIS